ncbi:MAG: ribbon-helix-helix protein, CopG family [Bifidobacteriaceae bacterium]|jgi:metal-responsive CopG/Arc/MetJ family transcriptional regulator|nr:ribbon-helix-helix protein, CopG family [Bifidobacteriaceae bacterium]
MKTAISLPNDLFERVDEASDRLAISRSELFARAARKYLDEIDNDALVEQINEAYFAEGPEAHAESEEFAAYSARRLADEAEFEDWS